MGLFFRHIFKKIKIFISGLIDKCILILPIYYTSVDQISLSKWWQVVNGNLRGLYKINLFTRIPYKFYYILLDMMFQFDNINMEIFEKEADLAILKSIAARNNDKSMKFQADVLANKLKKERENKSQEKQVTLNQFIDYIELTFNCVGSINPDKISASRAYSLYYKAIERNKYLQGINSKNVDNSK